MMRHRLAWSWMVSMVLLSLFLQNYPAVAAGPQHIILAALEKTREKSDVTPKSTMAASRDSGPIETIAAELRDGQVEDQKKTGGLINLIKRIRFISDSIQWRVYVLKSGAGTDPKNLPRLSRVLRIGENQEKPDPFKTITSVTGLLAASLVLFWLFRWFIAASYRRIENAASTDWKSKTGALVLRSLLDLSSMFIFTIAALVIFFVFMDRSASQSVLVTTYLSAFIIVMGAQLISSFLLTPKVSALRILPMDDGTAVYLHRWIMVIAVVGSFGFLTCGVFSLAGISEANHLIVVVFLELLIVVMIIVMILQKRESVRQALGEDLPEIGLRTLIVRNWHLLAIFALLILWLFSAFNQLLAGVRPSAPGIQTLLIIPLYFPLDWVLRQILRVIFGNAAGPQDVRLDPTSGASGIKDVAAAEYGEEATFRADFETAKEDRQKESSIAETEEPIVKKHLDVHGLNRIIGRGMRIALAAFVFFYLFDIWGIDIQFGTTVTRTAFNILVAVILCYVTWALISTAIAIRLRKEIPKDDDDEKEEGGSGGSRIATLLLLLRKFMLVVIIVMAVLIVLSALGVNIGPLIAGAGVFGLAIGFGSQTLVKDIISGVFFLMDDAFRVGDYLEVSGTKGTVEHISLRSIRLRNPRGMVYFIPFGDLKLVTNLSRDYVIMKLDFRVRYDADVEMIRRIIKKKVYQPIMEDPELGHKLLEPIKSQGVREMDDSAMIMRVKYKTKPGDQFAIRKEVYHLMQEAFRAEGIEFAHRNVTVYMPPEPGSKESAQAVGEDPQKDVKANSEIQRQAAAGAALAAIQAEEEKKLAAAKKPEK